MTAALSPGVLGVVQQICMLFPPQTCQEAFVTWASSRAVQAAQMDRYRELRALLRLLTHVTQRDLVDFGTAEGEASVDVAQARLSCGSSCCSVARQRRKWFPDASEVTDWPHAALLH